MNKHWAVLLLAIAATQAVAGEKEYTVRRCTENTATLQNCTECKEVKNAKRSFKVSKELGSIMQTSTKPDGVSHADVVDNCKIFDENNFVCVHEIQSDFIKGYDTFTIETNTLTVANGKWEWITKDDFGTAGKFQSYSCGYEIKNGLNFFK